MTVSTFWLGWLFGLIAGIAWGVFLSSIIREVRDTRAARRHVDAKIAAHEAEQARQ